MKRRLDENGMEMMDDDRSLVPESTRLSRELVEFITVIRSAPPDAGSQPKLPDHLLVFQNAPGSECLRRLARVVELEYGLGQAAQTADEAFRVHQVKFFTFLHDCPKATTLPGDPAATARIMAWIGGRLLCESAEAAGASKLREALLKATAAFFAAAPARLAADLLSILQYGENGEDLDLMAQSCGSEGKLDMYNIGLPQTRLVGLTTAKKDALITATCDVLSILLGRDDVFGDLDQPRLFLFFIPLFTLIRDGGLALKTGALKATHHLISFATLPAVFTPFLIDLLFALVETAAEGELALPESKSLFHWASELLRLLGSELRRCLDGEEEAGPFAAATLNDVADQLRRLRALAESCDVARVGLAALLGPLVAAFVELAPEPALEELPAQLYAAWLPRLVEFDDAAVARNAAADLVCAVLGTKGGERLQELNDGMCRATEKQHVLRILDLMIMALVTIGRSATVIDDIKLLASVELNRLGNWAFERLWTELRLSVGDAPGIRRGMRLGGVVLSVTRLEEKAEAAWLALLALPWLRTQVQIAGRPLPNQDAARELSRRLQPDALRSLKEESLRWLATSGKELWLDLRREILKLALTSSEASVVASGVCWAAAVTGRLVGGEAALSMAELHVLPALRLSRDSGPTQLRHLAACLCAAGRTSAVRLTENFEPEFGCSECGLESTPEEIEAAKQWHGKEPIRIAISEVIMKKLEGIIIRSESQTTDPDELAGGIRLLGAFLNHHRGEKRLENLFLSALWLMSRKEAVIRREMRGALRAYVRLVGASGSEDTATALLQKLLQLPLGSLGEGVAAREFYAVIVEESSWDVLVVPALGRLIGLAGVFVTEPGRSHAALVKAAERAGLGGDVQRLYRLHLPDVSRVLVKFVCTEFIADMWDSPDSWLEGSLEKTLRLLFSRISDQVLKWRGGLEPWTRTSLKHLVGWALVKATQESALVIKVVAGILNTDLHHILCDHMAHVFMIVVRFASERSNEIWVFAEKQENNKTTIPRHIGWEIFKCVNEMLLFLAEDEERVRLALARTFDDVLGRESPQITGCLETGSDGGVSLNMHRFLELRFLNVLMRFQQFFAEPCSVATRRISIKSLTLLFKHARGNVLDTVRFKGCVFPVLSVLRGGLGSEAWGASAWGSELGGAWLAFAESLSPTRLAAFYPHILVSVLPLLQAGHALDALLHFLFDAFPRSYKEAFPELREMSLVLTGLAEAEALQAYTRITATNSDLDAVIRACLSILGSHSQLYIKETALSRLLVALTSGASEVESWVLRPTLPPLISSLVSSLLGCLGGREAELSRLVGLCLGRLGAVDPGRLGLELSAPSTPGRRPRDHRPPPLLWPDFPLPAAPTKSASEGTAAPSKEEGSAAWLVQLLESLVQSLISIPDAGRHDKCSFSIQEVLRVLGVSGNGKGQALWAALKPSDRGLLSPLLCSKYAYSREVPDVAKLSGVTLFNHPDYGPDLTRWLSVWAHFLITKMKGVRAQAVFSAIRIWMDSDESFAEAQMPQLLLQALREPNSAASAHMSRNEIISVLNSWTSGTTSVSSEYRARALDVVLRCLEVAQRWVVENFSASKRGDGDWDRVRSWLVEIPPSLLHSATAAAGDAPRALRFFEESVARLTAAGYAAADLRPFLNSPLNPEQLDTLQGLYGRLDDSDSVVGALRLLRASGEPSLGQWILAHEARGDLTDALPYYQAAVASSDAARLGLVRCLLRLNQPALARHTAQDFATQPCPPTLSAELSAAEMEAAWKMGEWVRLSTLLEGAESESWAGGVAGLLHSAHDRDWPRLGEGLNKTRGRLSAELLSRLGSSPSYEGVYPTICRLHILTELEDAAAKLLQGRPQSEDELLASWEKRLHIVQSTSTSVEPILEVRRVLLQLATEKDPSAHRRRSHAPNVARLEKLRSEYWLESAKVARCANNLKTCRAFLVNAANSSIPDFFLEEAKASKTEGNVSDAIETLRRGLRQKFPLLSVPNVLKAVITAASEEERLACCKALVLLGRYCWESGAETAEEISQRFETALRVYPSWESAHYRAAHFLDQTNLVGNAKEAKGKGLDLEMVKRIIGLYVAALRCGSHHAHHTLPRLLTIWLDYAHQAVDVVKSLETQRKKPGKTKDEKLKYDRFIHNNRNLSENLSRFARKELLALPSGTTFPAFTQLISRLTHQCPKAAEGVGELLCRLIRDFPDQSLWLTVALYRSDPNTDRARRAKKLMDQAVLARPELKSRFGQLRRLCELLMAFAKKDVRNTACDMSVEAKELFNFFGDKDRLGTKLLIPLESLMEQRRTAPATISRGATDSMSQAEPSQGANSAQLPVLADAVHIASFDSAVAVMKSLQKPKLISICGSDGKRYRMMLKPGDDLRKDRRLIDFNHVVNSALRQDGEGRRRQLHVRTFGVLPLGPEGGMIEWVENLTPLRAAIDSTLARQGKGLPRATVAKESGSYNALPHMQQQRRYRELLGVHPPVLGEWLRGNFPDAAGWAAARLSYTRTSAVMCMVGYVLGLGDRHSENILLDLTSGDVFHVDFNLLFNKGEFLNVPELVPFRLTPNVVDGFGPLGVHGPFRHSCQVTMSILREKAGTLRTVMESFLHDPLVEWGRHRAPTPAGSSTQACNVANQKAEETLDMLVQRLSGRDVTPLKLEAGVKPAQSLAAQLTRVVYTTLPLNVLSHVDKLIEEAADPAVLCKMFFGWAPYL